MRVGVVIPARNEERRLPLTLSSLLSQKSVKILRVIVVDDGSNDRTAEVAKEFGVEVVKTNRRSRLNLAGTPYMARVINLGLCYLMDVKTEFTMILGADHLLPPYYLEIITSRMIRDNVVIASGVIEGEPIRKEIDVRGSGRVILTSWFKRIGYSYPEKWGFEGWLIYKALSMGNKVKVYRDLVTHIQRATATSPIRYYYWGKGMRALGYHPIYSLGRAALIGIKDKVKGLYLLKGYFSKVDCYPDISHFVRSYQAKLLLRLII